MNLAKLPVFIVLVIQIVHFQADCQKRCSCYTFENDTKFAWPQAQDSCKFNKKHLVVMETEREWEFIKNEIQTRKAVRYDEWLIGLSRNLTTGNWTWINGKPLTIDKWQENNPEDSDFYTLIFKEFPKNHKGSFATISGSVYRAWICEEETDACQGVCFYHNPVPTSSKPVTTTKATTQKGRETSTAYDHTDVSVDSITTTSVPGVGKQKDDDDNSSTIVIVAASLAALLFVVLVVLAVVLLLRRKKRSGHGEDTEIPKKKSSHQKAQSGENQYETVDRVEAAKLLGTPDKPRSAAKKNDEHELPSVNCEYAVVNKKNKKMTPDKSRPVAKKDEHELPTVNYEYAVVNKKDKKKDEHELPPVNCEYAVVNKKDKKRKDGDLVYAELAEFDDDNKETNPHKPPSYEPTVYADVDVVAPEVFSRADSDSTQPTYANVQTTGV